jgi:hypothetical protein
MVKVITFHVFMPIYTQTYIPLKHVCISWARFSDGIINFKFQGFSIILWVNYGKPISHFPIEQRTRSNAIFGILDPVLCSIRKWLINDLRWLFPFVWNHSVEVQRFSGVRRVLQAWRVLWAPYIYIWSKLRWRKLKSYWTSVPVHFYCFCLRN